MCSETLTELEQAINADPTYADLRHLLGAHYAQQGLSCWAPLDAVADGAAVKLSGATRH